MIFQIKAITEWSLFNKSVLSTFLSLKFMLSCRVVLTNSKTRFLGHFTQVWRHIKGEKKSPLLDFKLHSLFCAWIWETQFQPQNLTRARKWIHRPKAQHHRLRKIWSESGDKYVENWKEIFKAQLEIHLSTTHEQDHRACNTNWDWLARGASTEHCCYCL